MSEKKQLVIGESLTQRRNCLCFFPDRINPNQIEFRRQFAPHRTDRAGIRLAAAALLPAENILRFFRPRDEQTRGAKCADGGLNFIAGVQLT